MFPDKDKQKKIRGKYVRYLLFDKKNRRPTGEEKIPLIRYVSATLYIQVRIKKTFRYSTLGTVRAVRSKTDTGTLSACFNTAIWRSNIKFNISLHIVGLSTVHCIHVSITFSMYFQRLSLSYVIPYTKDECAEDKRVDKKGTAYRTVCTYAPIRIKRGINRVQPGISANAMHPPGLRSHDVGSARKVVLLLPRHAKGSRQSIS
jgi:hypothetical protein